MATCRHFGVLSQKSIFITLSDVYSFNLKTKLDVPICPGYRVESV